MKLKLSIVAILLVPWIHSAVSAQGILIRQGSYLKVPAGNMIHEPDNIITQDNCGLHAHGVVKIHGNLKNEDVTPACIDTGKVVFEGTTREKISGVIIFDSLVINNNNGVSLYNDVLVNKKLSLISGKIFLGNNNLLIGPSAFINGNLNSANMIVATGSGKLQKQFISAGSFTFPVGDTNGVSEYSPVALNFTNGLFGAGNWAGVNLVNAKYPDPNIQNDYLNRYWNISSNNISAFSCNAQFNYLPVDVVGTESKLYCLRTSPPPNTAFNPADTVNHIFTATGLNSFGSFTGGGPPCYNFQLNAAVVSNVSCFGGSNGAAIANISGASGNVTYQWSTNPVQTTKVAVNLIAGTYTVIATDALGCSKQSSVTINQPPQWWPGLSGPTTACANSTGNFYLTEAGMSNYQWLVSSGGIIISGAGTNSINVLWITAGPQTVNVIYTNMSGCTAFAPAILNVIIYPRPEPTITGPDSACLGTINNLYVTQPWMSAYNWTLSPGGSIVLGQGTNMIRVAWNSSGPQWVKVTYTSPNGCAAALPGILNVTVNTVPGPAGPISGRKVVCQGQVGVKYSVAEIIGAKGYAWSLPPGAFIAGGTNTDSITVNFSASAQSGFIQVHGTNNCGYGSDSPPLHITVSGTPPKPLIGGITSKPVTLSDTLFSSAPGGNQWFRDEILLSGDTNRFIVAHLSGEYYCIVTTGVCSSDSSNHVIIGSTGISEDENSQFVVYPVPNDGHFKASIVVPGIETFDISVYNYLGLIIYRHVNVVVNKKLEHSIDVSFAPNGMYMVQFRNHRLNVIRNILVIP